jgi:hypothetical protein
MRVVLGTLNGVYLKELLKQALPVSPFVRAAVAYAGGSHEFFDRCWESAIRLQYFGLLDHTAAVSLPVLEKFLRDGSGRFECRLVNGHFHAKVIWWQGYGAYIGSANLTHAAWSKNVECGVFFTDDELVLHGIGEQLEALFSYLQEHSLPLSHESYEKLSRLARERSATREAEREIERRFQALFGIYPVNPALTFIPGKGERVSRAQEQFVKEWFETLELMRRLTRRFSEMGRRPVWVAADAVPSVHFDQFLHAYYYDYIRGDDEGKSVEKVERAHERNKQDQDKAFEEVVSWWENLRSAPFEEDKFITTIAPRIRTMLALESVRGMDADSFARTMEHVNAFRTHARQVQNKTFGLPPNHKENMDRRAWRLADWLWRQRTEADRTVRDVLEFVLYGKSPPDMEQRLWLATHDPAWRIPHFGKSILGETVGWARLAEYPPRNNRMNKALRSLGYDVQLFSSE